MAENQKSWGAGRVAFIARLDKIKAELGQGVPLTAIYAHHQEALGIGYPSFCKLVNRYAQDAKLATRRTKAPTRPASPAPPVPPSPKPAPAPAAVTVEDAPEPSRSRPTFRPVTPRKD